MRLRSRRASIGMALLTGGGFLLAGPGTGCSSFLGESIFVAADFCFIFDCQNGILGGTVQPCATGAEPETGGLETDPAGPLFVDCP